MVTFSNQRLILEWHVVMCGCKTCVLKRVNYVLNMITIVDSLVNIILFPFGTMSVVGEVTIQDPSTINKNLASKMVKCKGGR